MKFIALLALFVSAQCAFIPARNTALESGSNLEKRASCNVCVTTVNGQSTTYWDSEIPYDQGGHTSRGIYVGCDAHIDRKRTTNCAQWSVWTSGTCGTVTKHQTC
ncbi:hypothetical protein BFJ65_g14762 [Fusarium oxysporum f. sp. cepae]|uniref:Uncharacterized protein n=1 Tax=Fusarium oxysporum f. sp. cepae TaxID=396571 RepID=A0A3L6N1T6_FUSOX|nr:hypothetical protein BFJ65_g14762 [Fusarium oxysporum f. sp. cepae]RKK19216.1 hypothetical protein BFJ67_g17528 [Fusarium oxysporum f. sp. cepae]